MVSEQEMMKDLAAADAAGDTELAQHIAARIKAQRASMEHPPAQTPVGDLPGMGLVKSAGTGIAHGLSTIGSFVGDIMNIGKDVTNIPPMPGSKDIRELVGKATGMSLYEPQTPAEKYVRAGAETATATVPGNWKQALTGIVAGLTGEGAANQFTAHPELARAAGTMLPLLGAMYPAFRKPTMVKATKSFVDELGPEGIAAIDAARNKVATRIGSPVLLSQGSENPELTGIVQAIANSPEGGQIRKVLRDQLLAGQHEAEKLTAGLPGTGSQREANTVLGSANKIMDNINQELGDITAPLYAQADKQIVDPQALRDAIEAIKTKKQFLAGSQPAQVVDATLARLDKTIAEAKGTPARTVESTVLGPDGRPITTEIPGVPGEPTTATALSRSYKQPAQTAVRMAENRAASTEDVQNLVANKAVAGTVKDVIAPEGSAQRAADDLYAALAKEKLDPLTKGAFETLFPAKMRVKERGDMTKFVNRFDSLRAEDIAHVGKIMREHGQEEAFLNIAKESLSRKVAAAMDPTAGRTGPEAFNSLANSLAGPAPYAKRAAAEQLQYEIALSQGKTPAEAAQARQGFSDLIDAFHMISRDRSGLAAGGAQSMQAATENWFTRLLKSASFTAPLRGFGYGMQESARKNLVADVTKAVTTNPEMLIKIAKYNYKGQIAKAMARGISAVENATQRE